LIKLKNKMDYITKKKTKKYKMTTGQYYILLDAIKILNNLGLNELSKEINKICSDYINSK